MGLLQNVLKLDVHMVMDLQLVLKNFLVSVSLFMLLFVQLYQINRADEKRSKKADNFPRNLQMPPIECRFYRRIYMLLNGDIDSNKFRKLFSIPRFQKHCRIFALIALNCRFLNEIINSNSMTQLSKFIIFLHLNFILMIHFLNRIQFWTTTWSKIPP